MSTNLGRESNPMSMSSCKSAPMMRRRRNPVRFPQPSEDKWHLVDSYSTKGLGGGGFRTTKVYPEDY